MSTASTDSASSQDSSEEGKSPLPLLHCLALDLPMPDAEQLQSLLENGANRAREEVHLWKGERLRVICPLPESSRALLERHLPSWPQVVADFPFLAGSEPVVSPEHWPLPARIPTCTID